MSDELVKVIQSEYEPKSAAIVVGDRGKNYGLMCESLVSPIATHVGLADINVTEGVELLSLVVDAIADRDAAQEFVESFEKELRQHCRDSEEKEAQITAIILQIKQQLNHL